LKHLDCTLRDGGYQNNWNFSKRFIEDYINLMVLLRLDIIELGIRSHIRNDNFGSLSYCADSDLDILPEVSQIYAVLVNISEFIDEDITYFRTLFPNNASASRFKIVRMVGTLESIQRCRPHIEYLKSKDYTVCINIMRISTVDEARLFSLREVIANLEFDVLYIADSLGGLTETTTSGKLQMLRKITSKDIGVHMHDNQGVALQNTLVAKQSGATWLDTTLMGMGRGAGNAATERLLIALGNEANLPQQTDFIQKYIVPIFSNSSWGPSLDFYYAGFWNLHPNYVTEMRELKLSINQIIFALSRLRLVGGDNFDLLKLEKILSRL